MREDTIAACATPVGGALAIVRISGPAAIQCAQALCGKKLEHRTLVHATLACEDEALDDAMAAAFYAPASYTGEDMAELYCHGGASTVTAVLRALFALGVRPADPGEFTQRAFLAGKLDLTQAEAVCDVIAAGSDAARRGALRHLSGTLLREIKEYASSLVDLTARIEAVIAYPEEDLQDTTAAEITSALPPLLDKIETLADTFAYGRAVKEGVQVVILGKPNVGKSSLFNALAGEDAAIVTPLAGTTRDTIERGISLQGNLFRFTDTAGIRNTGDEIEQMGVARSQKAAQTADVTLFVLDGSAPLDDADMQAMGCVQGRTVVVLNKCDLPHTLREGSLPQALQNDCVRVSCKTGEGLERLKEKLLACMDRRAAGEGEIITNARHYTLLRKAADHARQALEAARAGVDVDLIGIDLMGALDALGEITGDNATEDVVARIFEKFCLGK